MADAPTGHGPSARASAGAVPGGRRVPATVRERPPLVIVTGASSGLGAALAVRLARPDTTVGLVGRNADGLERTAEAVTRRGGRALVGRIDLTGPAFGTWVAEAAQRFTLGALYANAGLSAGPASPAELESAADTERLVHTNLLGTVASVRAVVEEMRRQPRQALPRRHIAIVSSVAGLLPTPDLAVYGATKAALVAYAHGLRPRLKRDNILVTVVCPGFVTSPMSARHQGARPFEVPANAAAERILAAVRRGRRTLVFPWPYRIMAALAPLAPGALIDRLVPAFEARIVPDPRLDAPGGRECGDRPAGDGREKESLGGDAAPRA